MLAASRRERYAPMALASASERLRRIEEDAGVPLLERLPRGVVTTEAGEALAHHARLMMRQHDLLKGELQDFATGARGTLHFYANTAALTEFLPSRLAPWLAQRPNLHIELKERTSADIVRTVVAWLARGRCVSDAVQAAGLVLEPVAKDYLVLIMACGSSFGGVQKIEPADVLHDPFVGLMPGNALQDHIDEHARAAGHALAHQYPHENLRGALPDGGPRCGSGDCSARRGWPLQAPATAL